VSILSILLDGITLFLFFQATTKCVNIYQSQTCYSTLPWDIGITVLLGFVLVLDILQTMDLNKQRAYISKQIPEKTDIRIKSRRIRLLHLWSWPFSLGILISEAILDDHSITFKTVSSPLYAPIVLTPILIMTSTMTKPPVTQIIGLFFTFLCTCCDVLAYYFAFVHESFDVTKSTYLIYKQWCLCTLLVLDAFLMNNRWTLVWENTESNRMAMAAVNMAKWQVERFRNPVKTEKKNG